MHVPPPVALPCAHFLPSAAGQVQNFGEPFFMVIREDETLSSIKERLQKKLKVSDEDFSKWKFVYISLGCPDYFEDSDTVATRFQRYMYRAWAQYLGLEHPDTAPRKAHSANQDWLLKLLTEPEKFMYSDNNKVHVVRKLKSMYMEVDDCYSRLKGVFLENGTSEEFSLLLPQLARSKGIVDKAKLKSATSVEDMH
ncbi:hypothetical protein CFC21_035024 [Triticum aestivum]|uniref:ubiquitinyl hydrolase 1 n=3 Tax=Triticum TaxID=4564 RepID=A0A9R0RK75_TRITD|nr:hypothetical protein CFC21_035024 [Triticum aestivum]VAH59874.1 unnamed protein product [Triticum turgidum subsp. durum]